MDTNTDDSSESKPSERPCSWTDLVVPFGNW